MESYSQSGILLLACVMRKWVLYHHLGVYVAVCEVHRKCIVQVLAWYRSKLIIHLWH